MALDAITPNDAKKITEIIDSGTTVLGEIDMLKEDLKSHVQTLAELYDIKPAIINKAIKLAYKDKTDSDSDPIAQAQQDMSDVEILLHAAGKIS